MFDQVSFNRSSFVSRVFLFLVICGLRNSCLVDIRSVRLLWNGFLGSACHAIGLFEKRHLMIALTLGNAAAMALFYVIPPDQYWLMVALGFAGALVVGPTTALVWSMYADCADYGEWKTGRRTTALVFSASQFAQKCAQKPETFSVAVRQSDWIHNLPLKYCHSSKPRCPDPNIESVSLISRASL